MRNSLSALSLDGLEEISGDCPTCGQPFAITPSNQHRFVNDPNVGTPVRVCHDVCVNGYRSKMHQADKARSTSDDQEDAKHALPAEALLV